MKDFIEVPATMRDMSQEDPERKCRFCWDSFASKENPLLGTCNCTGSMGCIHFNCLFNWLESRKQVVEQKNFKTFVWKAFECEICKAAYPLQMKARSEEGNCLLSFDLIKYQRPKGDFMVLESLMGEKNHQRVIHIISPSKFKTQFGLGRGNESDLRINDISISRHHSQIKFKNGKFFLADN